MNHPDVDPTRNDGSRRASLEDAEEVDGIDLLSSVQEDAAPARRGKAGWIFAGAAVVVIVLVIVLFVNLAHRHSAADTASSTVASQVRHASDAKTASAQAGGGKLTVVSSRAKNAFAVQVKNLPALKDGEEYQISVTHTDASQSFERVGLVGRKPTDTWHGYRGVKNVASVHLTPVAEGGEDAPEQEDLSEVKLAK